MIYALVGASASVADRETILQALAAQNAAVLAQYAAQGIICHIMDIVAHQHYRCIWCLDPVSPSRRNGPRGYQVAAPWYFMHTTNNQCIGYQNQVGTGLYVNPQYQGCYVQMGCEQAPQRSRQECQCILGGQTYCHHAPNPGPGGACV
jgi:hypothetical protein